MLKNRIGTVVFTSLMAISAIITPSSDVVAKAEDVTTTVAKSTTTAAAKSATTTSVASTTTATAKSATTTTVATTTTATTTTEIETVGEDSNLDTLHVGDWVSFDKPFYLYDKPYDTYMAMLAKERMYIIDIYPEKENSYVVYFPLRQKRGSVYIAELDGRTDFTINPTTLEVPIMGDVNYDGVVDVFDLIILRKFILRGEVGGADSTYFISDLNYDGRVSTADMVKLAKFILGEK